MPPKMSMSSAAAVLKAARTCVSWSRPCGNMLLSTATLPPAIVRSKEGKAPYSLRVLLLPYLDKGEELFRQFDLNVGDGPNNKKLLARMPRVYALPQARKEVYTTHGTDSWSANIPLSRKVSSCWQPIWSRWRTARSCLPRQDRPFRGPGPNDVNVDQGTCFPRLGGLFPEGFHVAFADGRVCFIPEKEPRFPGNFVRRSDQASANRAGLLRNVLAYDESIAYQAGLRKFWHEQLQQDDCTCAARRWRPWQN